MNGPYRRVHVRGVGHAEGRSGQQVHHVRPTRDDRHHRQIEDRGVSRAVPAKRERQSARSASKNSTVRAAGSAVLSNVSRKLISPNLPSGTASSYSRMVLHNSHAANVRVSAIEQRRMCRECNVFACSHASDSVSSNSLDRLSDRHLENRLSRGILRILSLNVHFVVQRPSGHDFKAAIFDLDGERPAPTPLGGMQSGSLASTAGIDIDDSKNTVPSCNQCCFLAHARRPDGGTSRPFASVSFTQAPRLPTLREVTSS